MSEEKRAKRAMVSFSKRRKGLFQKASELCTKCGAEIAVLVVSSAGNPFSFGHSSVGHVLRRAAKTTTVALSDAIDGERERFQARESEDLKARAKRKEEEEKEASDIAAWFEREFEACETVEQLEFLRSKCLDLRGKIAERLRNDSSFVEGKGFEFDGEGWDLDFDLVDGRDEKNLGIQNDMSLMPEYFGNDVWFSENFDYSYGTHEIDTSFMAEFDCIADGYGSSVVGTMSADHVFDFLGQNSFGFDEDFWGMP